MSRETSPYIVGDFWLDKRRDGQSPDVWQIAWNEARSVRYKSTRCRALDDAIAAIQAHNAAFISKLPQRADDALVVPLLMLYWDERGSKARGPGQIASSLRQFIAFLDQDEATMGVTVAQLNRPLFDRFQAWRMKPHGYELEWQGKVFRHQSKGVNGESVQRNFDDVRAALSHHADYGRLPYAPKVPAVIKELRSAPRDRVLSRIELGAIFGLAAYDIGMFRFLSLILATAVRTEAALKFDPVAQYDQERELIDLHPKGEPRTKKHNPVVPCIPEFGLLLKAWAKEGSTPVRSRKTRWRTLRRLAGLGQDVEPKTIRHTVATRLRGMKVQPQDVESLLGHRVYRGSSAVYAKYDPDYLIEAKAALSRIFADTMMAAWEWAAVHRLSKIGNHDRKVIARDAQ